MTSRTAVLPAVANGRVGVDDFSAAGHDFLHLHGSLPSRKHALRSRTFQRNDSSSAGHRRISAGKVHAGPTVTYGTAVGGFTLDFVRLIAWSDATPNVTGSAFSVAAVRNRSLRKQMTKGRRTLQERGIKKHETKP
jgi:hypothetical protein